MRMKDKHQLCFGIVQGRLIASTSDQLQWFPQNYWETEFFLAPALGFNYVELIAERIHNPNNPLWTDEGVTKIKELSQRNNLLLSTFTNDFVVDNTLLGNDIVLEQNLRLIERGSLLGCDKYILPLFEQSELVLENITDYKTPLCKIADKAAEYGIMLCLETNLDGNQLIEALNNYNHPAISVVYDTGNRVALGHNLSRDIQLLGDRISHVHIKDKNKDSKNVILGTGLVNFLHVFDALSKINYVGPYTFETTRGKEPLRTASYNIEFVKFFHAEAFSQ